LHDDGLCDILIAMKSLIPCSVVLFSFMALVAEANDTAVNAAAAGPAALGEFVGEESVIRMVSEKIDITFGKEESRVHCTFVFRSTKKSGDALQLLGFPDFIDDGGVVGTIKKMVSRIDGVEVAAKKQRGYLQNDNQSAHLGDAPVDLKAVPVNFHTIEVKFPPDRDVIVEREYTVGNGGSVEGDTMFFYTTETGGVWKGNIGKAEFTVTLEGWTVSDLAFEDGPQKIEPRRQRTFSSPNRSEWKIESPTKMKLVWENFEPAVHESRRQILLNTWVRKAE